MGSRFERELAKARKEPKTRRDRERDRDLVRDFREHYGVRPHRELAAFLEQPRTGWARMYGCWCPATPRIPAPDGSLVDLVEIAFTHPFALVGSFSSTISIGCDGGGQEYMVEIDPGSSAVHLFGPGVGELKYLADSLDAFLQLNAQMEAWTRYEKAHRIDFGEVEDGDIDPNTLAIPGIRRAMRGLVDRVRLTGFDRSDMASDFDEILPTISGVRPRARPPSNQTSKLHARAYGIQMNLRIRPGYLLGETFGINGFKKPPRLPRLPDVAADSVYHLWRAFLLQEDDVFEAERRRAASHRAGFVRRTADLLGGLLDRTAPRELDRFREYRALIALGPPKPFTPTRPERALTKKLPGDPPLLAKARAAVAVKIDDAKAWDALAFALGESEAWGAMKEAAEARLRIDPGDYYPWLQLGVAESQLGEDEAALVALDRSLAFSSVLDESGSAWINKAGILARHEHVADARAHLRRAIKARPSLRDHAKDDPDLAPLVR